MVKLIKLLFSKKEVVSTSREIKGIQQAGKRDHQGGYWG